MVDEGEPLPQGHVHGKAVREAGNGRDPGLLVDWSGSPPTYPVPRLRARFSERHNRFLAVLEEALRREEAIAARARALKLADERAAEGRP